MAKDSKSPADNYKPTAKEEERLNESYDRFTTARDARQHIDEDWEAYEKQWEGYFGNEQEDSDRDTSGEYRSNIWVPMTFWLTMAAMTEYVQQNPSLIYNPSGEEDAPLAEIHQEIANYSLEIGDFIIQWYKACLDASIFGTAPMYEYYRCESRKIKELSMYDPQTMKFDYNKKKIEDFKDVYAESFSPYHFYPQPYVEDQNKMKWAFRRFIFDEKDFHALYNKKFKNAKYVLPAVDHRSNDPDWNWWDTSGMTYLNEDQIEVLWEWNEIKDEMNVMANGVLLTEPDMPIPYNHKKVPIAVINSTRRAHRIWGKSMCEVLEKLQYERNAMRNLSLDQARLNILKIFFVNPDSGLSDDQLQLKPGLAIPVKGDPRNAVYPLEYSGLKGERYKEEEMMDQDAVRATGISPELTGVNKADSATQAAIMKEATLKRIRLQMTMNYEEGLTRLGRLRLANIKQFYRNPLRVQKIIGDDGVERFVKEFRRIRLKDKALAISTMGENMGQYYLQPYQGFSFFQTIPELFGDAQEERYYDYDVKVDPQSTIKESRLLTQEREKTFFEIFRGDPDIDQKKLKEGYIKSLDKSPDELIVQQPLALGGGGGGVSPSANLPGAEVAGSNPVTRTLPSASEARSASRVLPGFGGANI